MADRKRSRLFAATTLHPITKFPPVATASVAAALYMFLWNAFVRGEAEILDLIRQVRTDAAIRPGRAHLKAGDRSRPPHLYDPAEFETNERELFVETLVPAVRLLIFGAGDDAIPLTDAAKVSRLGSVRLRWPIALCAPRKVSPSRCGYCTRTGRSSARRLIPGPLPC